MWNVIYFRQTRTVFDRSSKDRSWYIKKGLRCSLSVMDPEFEEGPSFEVPQNGEPVGIGHDYSLSAQNDDLVFPESVQVNNYQSRSRWMWSRFHAVMHLPWSSFSIPKIIKLLDISFTEQKKWWSIKKKKDCFTLFSSRLQLPRFFQARTLLTHLTSHPSTTSMSSFQPNNRWLIW